jgi:hypothetical protein
MPLREILTELNKIREGKELINLINRLKNEIILIILEGREYLDRGSVSEIKNAIDKAVDKFKTEFEALLTENQRRLFWRAIKIIDEILEKQGYKLTLPYVSEEILETLKEYNAELITRITDEARAKIKLLITQGVLGGQGAEEIIKQLIPKLPSKSIFSSLRQRAEVIQRTEMNRIYAQATFERFKQYGAVLGDKLYKKWIHSHLGVPRKSHLLLHNKEIRWDEKFVIKSRKGDYEVFGPYDPILPAEEVVNCRCVIIPVIKEQKKV